MSETATRLFKLQERRDGIWVDTQYRRLVQPAAEIRLDALRRENRGRGIKLRIRPEFVGRSGS